MKSVLHKFITEPLFDATEAMLSHLHIKFTAQSKTPLSFAELYSDTTSSPMPQVLQQVVDKVNNTYLIGAIDEDSLEGRQSDFDIQKPLDGKYQTMLVFAVDIKAGLSLTRGELATLTRGFNRMAPQLPVVVFVKNGDKLTLATCERSEYRQNWREGEKLGKVSILRDINCAHPHRGHIDILETLGDKAYPTFDELYKHWLDVFSSELLTRKFYTELSEWYAWVISSGEVKFPNDLSTTEDDAKYNHEAVIRLITRLIFVWFLKQKKLIPGEFFDEKAIAERFIENFDPHSTDSLFYDPKQSKYYRLILQNLFFAMLNRPIKDEESGNDENRRFVTDRRYKGVSTDYNINNLLRYRSEFKEGGADRLLEVANSQIPFLNGGLFECLDDKDNGMYYDGFSERKASLEQLSFPDYFFFGEEVGQDVDLSAWYDDKKKNHVHVHSLINILNHYNFTVEENTPLDQEVSLDPELLGKVFENLLASYNPETNTTARKQTGSFYTPRDIVKYMVDESLIAHLKRTCPALGESVFRNLFDYSVDNFDVPEADRKAIMSALYNCKVLDPACGSGAFPMGILQQMVHALRKLDPTNEMWREFILDISLKKDKEAYQIEDEEERTRLRADIEQSFNRNVNDPDYARKLYLIENCIYGVDIQPIATQISKLRFFISLVAEQKPKYDDPINNFGLRLLPNLEAKFVSANTLLPLSKESNLFGTSDRLERIKKRLAEANHKIFRAKNNVIKRSLRQQIENLRKEYSDELISMGTIGPSSAQLLADWNMFNQNLAAHFFDPEWMFGITNGFDVVIGNPPYVLLQNTAMSTTEKDTLTSIYKVSQYKVDLYHLFIEKGCNLLTTGGVLVFINPTNFLTNNYTSKLRKFILVDYSLNSVVNIATNVFEANVNTGIFSISNSHKDRTVSYSSGVLVNRELVITELSKCERSYYNKDNNYLIQPLGDDKSLDLISKIENIGSFVKDTASVSFGMQLRNRKIFTEDVLENPDENQITEFHRPCLTGKDINFFTSEFANRYCYFNRVAKCGGCWDENLHNTKTKVLVRQVGSVPVCGIDTNGYAILNSAFMIVPNNYNAYCLMGLINSKVIRYYWGVKFEDKRKTFPKIKGTYLEQIPIPSNDNGDVADCAFAISNALKRGEDATELLNRLDYIVYKLYGLSYNDILIIDPETTITEEEYNRRDQIN